MCSTSTGKAMDYARQLLGAGRTGEAEQVCRAVLAREPNHVDALGLAGLIVFQTGHPAAAVELFQRAIAIRPAAELYVNLAPALQQSGRLDEAIAACRKAIELKPAIIGAYQNLAQALHKAGRFEEAEDACRRGIALTPDYAAIYNTLALSLQAQSRVDEATVACRRAAELAPRFHAPWNTLGIILQDQGRLEESVAHFQHAISLNPNAATSHYNLGMSLLLAGDLRRGFEKYEWRWKCTTDRAPHVGYSQPRWDGSDLDGQTVLLHAEQGLGDTIQFIRYAPLVAQRGGRVIVACQPELQRLLSTVDGISEVVTVSDAPPAFDVHLPLGSLPLAFATEIDTIPRAIPYLHADLNLAEAWRSRMARQSRGLNVGVAWAGNPNHPNDRNRSIDPQFLTPLLDVPDANFYSLQKGSAGSQRMIDLTAGLDDFAETAALVANLDLIISADTSVAHLAGAMAKPVWLLLPVAPDWRWMRNRADSPWYPTARLYRQRSRQNWPEVIRQVAADLLTSPTDGKKKN